MSGWIVVSFYTSGTAYEQEIGKLKASLLKFGLPYKFYAYPPLGTWRRNLNYKSECILRAFDEFPDKDIVFIDADGIIKKYPVLFDWLSDRKDFDVACHYFRYSFSNEELLSGTLWFKNNEIGKALVQRWDDLGRAQPKTRHQICLKLAIEELRMNSRPARVYRLPIEYTCIFDAPARRGKEAVVEHYQASRRLRHSVGYGEALVQNPRRSYRARISPTRAMLRTGNLRTLR